MGVGEFAADMEDATAQRFAGSLDSGAVDAEYSPILYQTKPEGITSGADERHKALERRVVELEHGAAKLAVTLGGLLSDMGKVNKRIDTLFESIPARTLPATKAAELAELRAEVAALGAQWAGVPWAALRRLLLDVGEMPGEGAHSPIFTSDEDFNAANRWLATHAPQPEAQP